MRSLNQRFPYTRYVMQKGRQAFTMIELMAATTIMLILIAAVFDLATQVMDSWTRATTKLSSNAEARLALDLIAKDLESAIVKGDGKEWIAIRNVQLDPYGDGGVQSDSIYFYAPTSVGPSWADTNTNGVKDAGETLHGDVMAIGYQVHHDNPFDPGNGGNPKAYFGLYRAAIDPEITFGSGSPSNDGMLDQSDGSGGSVTLLSEWGDPNNYAFLDENNQRLSSPITGDAYLNLPQNLLALNVVRLKVSIIYWNGTAEVVESVPDDGTYVIPIASPLGELIALELSIQVVSDQGAKLLQSPTPNLQAVLNEFGSTYTRRVTMNPSPF